MIPGIGNKILIKTTTVTTLKEGLISVWELDETSGTNAADSYGINNGTSTNVTVNQTGVINKAYSFNGSSSLVTIGNPSSLQLTSSVSISSWVKINAYSATVYQRIFSKLSAATYNGYELLIQNSTTLGVQNKPYVQFANAGTLYSAYANSAISLNTWTHLVATYDGTTIKMYVNGTLQSTPITQASAIGATSVSALLGRWAGSASQYLNGYLDQTAVWNKGLTQEEAVLLYNGGNGLPYTSW